MISSKELNAALGGACLVIAIAVTILLVVVVAIYPEYTSDDAFRKNIQIDLLASDRYSESNTIFLVRIHSSAHETTWPGAKAHYRLLVDGVEKQVPQPFPAFPASRRLRGWAQRELAWWMTVQEMTNWIGAGDHEFVFVYRTSTSNVLRINIPHEGRIAADPEYSNAAWTFKR